MEEVLDLDPAVVNSIVQRSDHVAIVFLEQPCYSRAMGDNPRVVPFYECEIRVWDAEVELLRIELPYETGEWEVEFEGGSRRCFLPMQFEAGGPIRLSIGPTDSPRIVVTGKRVSLEVGKQVKTVEEWNAT